MRIPLFALLCLPVAAYAVMDDVSEPPEPTETTELCDEGLIWDLATQSCMSPEDSTNDDQAKLNDIRELAYAGLHQAALDTLNTLDNPNSSMALTYFGFAHRKVGDAELSLTYYHAALQKDPSNILARSYMGQGFAEAGEMALAQAQLVEIRMQGGLGTWADIALESAIRSGQGYSY